MKIKSDTKIKIPSIRFGEIFEKSKKLLGRKTMMIYKITFLVIITGLCFLTPFPIALTLAVVPIVGILMIPADADNLESKITVLIIYTMFSILLFGVDYYKMDVWKQQIEFVGDQIQLNNATEKIVLTSDMTKKGIIVFKADDILFYNVAKQNSRASAYLVELPQTDRAHILYNWVSNGFDFNLKKITPTNYGYVIEFYSPAGEFLGSHSLEESETSHFIERAVK